MKCVKFDEIEIFFNTYWIKMLKYCYLCIQNLCIDCMQHFSLFKAAPNAGVLRSWIDLLKNTHV
ncbi:MAG: hypothetical protein EZS26_002794 [Candidatus Ordinivivax streblomastigis]|uniref:Uncharacterized protein n=1 Tax=Candidatus Ordinivivax streblomastigis TaxID=2540710 RepID=A0A5M8NYN0_9BACT|nr:MAG: hypothetical protein EZS26_002794 [Candidatus Ordinivivax streblomastigis]